jgi:hypothetical protein
MLQCFRVPSILNSLNSDKRMHVAPTKYSARRGRIRTSHPDSFCRASLAAWPCPERRWPYAWMDGGRIIYDDLQIDIFAETFGLHELTVRGQDSI